MGGRPGLLRTVLEAQETRGLTRSGDISRLLPAEAAVLARGRRVRQAKLLFYARLAEKGLQTYERDGWGEFPTQINPDRREIRPTADRGPILLCVDTSGSMRGARETVAKALALECMRAAREQERDCYVFAFSGPQEVRGVFGGIRAGRRGRLAGDCRSAPTCLAVREGGMWRCGSAGVGRRGAATAFEWTPRQPATGSPPRAASGARWLSVNLGARSPFFCYLFVS
jgi:hypothetical protein